MLCRALFVRRITDIAYEDKAYVIDGYKYVLVGFLNLMDK